MKAMLLSAFAILISHAFVAETTAQVTGATGGTATANTDTSILDQSTEQALLNRTGGRTSFLAADLLSAQADVISAAGQANYFSALGAREIQEAQRIHLANQRLLFEQKVRHYQQKEQEMLAREAKYARQRLEREAAKATRQASLAAEPKTISWPKPLRKSKYQKFRVEIESLAKLYGDLNQNAGIEVGLKTAIRNLANQIIEDEKAGLIDDATSREIRSFVINLDRNNGQTRRQAKPDSKKLFASNM